MLWLSLSESTTIDIRDIFSSKKKKKRNKQFKFKNFVSCLNIEPQRNSKGCSVCFRDETP